jgi:hypothetical protein
VRRLADSTVAFFAREKLRVSRGRIGLRSEKYGPKYGLCADARFYDQPSASDFSGALVGRDLVLTAGHAIRTAEDCERFVAVFGYRREDGEGSEPREIRAADVYECKEIVARAKGKTGDFALIRLREAVEDRVPLEVERAPDRVGRGTELIVMGHPNGLPLRIAGDARVRRSQDDFFFEADTDTFNGNSGSPVFDAGTGRIAGILVDGSEPDFTTDPRDGCKRPTRCRQDGCGSEIVTRSSVFESWIP